MLVSIGMIVKNEEKYLRKCLEALKPILDKVDSELIIVDTGSTDSTIEIARAFTDKVYHFDWCDDFAAARNAAMKRATGLWYMSIDADEIISDPKGIIDFFNSGEYKKYNAASYVIRSSNEADLKTGGETNSVRLIKLQKDSYYVNPVHEKFNKVYGPIKVLNVIIDHFGYVTENNSEYIEYKNNRNLKIMLDQLKKEPFSAELHHYIGNSYRMLGDDVKAHEYIDKGIELLRGKNDPLIYAFYSNKTAIYYKYKRFRDVIRTADEYFGLKNEALGTDLEIYCAKAESFYQLHMYKEAAEAFKNYAKLFLEYKKGLHRTVDTFLHSVNYTSDVTYKAAILHLARSLIEIENYKEARSYLRSVTIEEWLESEPEYIANCIELEFNVMEKLGDFTHIIELYKSLKVNHMPLICGFIEKELNKEAYRSKLLALSANFDKEANDNYSCLLALRHQYSEGNLSPQALEEYLSGIDEMLPVYADAIYFAAAKKLPMKLITSKIDPSDIKNYFYDNQYYHFSDLIIYMQKACREQKLDLYSVTWLAYYFYYEMVINPVSEESARGLFEAYAQCAYAVLTGIYKAEILQKAELQVIPRQLRSGYYCHMAIQAFNDGNELEYVRNLKAVIRTDSYMANIVKILTNEFTKKKDEGTAIKSEFEEYAIKAKEAIKKLIKTGQTGEALQFISVYESMVPNDEEIEALKLEAKSMN